MDKVTKVYFDPLMVTKDQICSLLRSLPVGSAHPFRPEGILLVHLERNTVSEVDISNLPEDYFSNAINLAELGEGSLERIKSFPELAKFSNEYMIQQTPGPTFKVPLVSDEITIFAVSELDPNYYDLCIADSDHNTSCYNACFTFPGLTHSGDINTGSLLLHHIKFNHSKLEEKAYVIFVSGYDETKLTKYKEKNPLVLIANHDKKVLYVLPVPLDQASIGKAILCCPMVIKADKSDNTLICSVLPAPTTDDNLMCSGITLPSNSFRAAVRRADFTIVPASLEDDVQRGRSSTRASSRDVQEFPPPLARSHFILASSRVTVPDITHLESSQLVRFGTGIFWMDKNDSEPLEGKSASVLPCVLGGMLSGPLLLATGDVPEHFHFESDSQLHEYYENAKTVTVVVGEEMTDNSRNLAPSWRINALFIVQSRDKTAEKNSNIRSLLNNLNINAVTALAGPQSLILAQVGNRYYYYRGIANKTQFDFTEMEFGKDVTEIVQNADLSSLTDAKWPRLVNLSAKNKVFLLDSGEQMSLEELEATFEKISLTEISALESDIISVLPQLQTLLPQADLDELSSRLLRTLQAKITQHTSRKKSTYIQFLTREYVDGDKESKKRKDRLLAELRHAVKETQACVGWLTTRLGNIMSSQQTSTKSHDIKRLIRQSAIRNNVEIAKTMTFEKMGELLEEHADEMGVLLVNVDTESYCQLLQNPGSQSDNSGSCLELDPRILHLDGLDAGIVLHQSQDRHTGPLVSQLGSHQPILALPYIGNRQGEGSMLAWVCWDEFVNLEDPSTVRWVEKCNEVHIATLRIIMRETISKAVCSREFNMSAASGATGHLMSFLLVTSMHKLANLRTTEPTQSVQAADTVTKLMRGLFGHFLTLAGSGIQPTSMVWQMMGKNPLPEVPNSTTDWSWYENVATLYPYTGWPARILNKNLELLLDKILFRLLTRNKRQEGSRQLRAAMLKQGRIFRNLQLSNLRTIVVGLMEILAVDSGRDKMAKNLLRILPKPIEDNKQSYARLYSYVEHLAKGGACHGHFSASAANIYTRRSALFKDAKAELIAAVKVDDIDQARAACRQIIEKRKWVALKFRVEEDAVKVQGLKSILRLLAGSPTTVKEKKDLYMRIKGDPESRRESWQIGNGQYGVFSPLNIDSLLRILHDTDSTLIEDVSVASPIVSSTSQSTGLSWDQLAPLVLPEFLKTVQSIPSAEKVCEMLQVPQSMMRIFISALAPQFEFDRLQYTFRDTVYALLVNQDQNTMKPTRKLFGNLMLRNSSK